MRGMGKLIKNHWARLVVLSAAACRTTLLTHGRTSTNRTTPTVHFGAALEGFFWPKFFFDFLTKNFDKAVKPIPILQIINICLAIISLIYEWPLKCVAGSAIHKSLTLRMFWLPLVSLSSALLYQGMNPALYYLIGMVAYFWAYSEGEVSRGNVQSNIERGADRLFRSYVQFLGHYPRDRIEYESLL